MARAGVTAGGHGRRSGIGTALPPWAGLTSRGGSGGRGCDGPPRYATKQPDIAGTQQHSPSLGEREINGLGWLPFNHDEGIDFTSFRYSKHLYSNIQGFAKIFGAIRASIAAIALF